MVTQINTRLTALEAEIAAQTVLLNTIDGKIMALQNIANEINTKVDAVQVTATDTNTRLKTVEKTVNDIRTKVDSLENTLNSLNGKVDWLKRAVEEIDKKANSKVELAKVITVKVDWIKSNLNMDKLSPLLNDIKSRVDVIREFQNALKFLDDKMNALTHKLEDLDVSIKTKETKIINNVPGTRTSVSHNFNHNVHRKLKYR
jgi:chromosome segregation ATPase